MKVNLAYFNLVLIVAYFGIEMVTGSIDFILSIGSIAILWYNWEVSKRLKGQPSHLNKINVAVGMVVLLFSVLIAAEGFYRILQEQTENPFSMFASFGIIQVAIGFSNLLIAAKTIRVFTKT